jgi:hypothetical protein
MLVSFHTVLLSTMHLFQYSNGLCVHLQSVFDFIDVLEDVKPGTYRLVMAPRRVFTDKEHESSLQSLGLTSKSLLNFELII